MKKISLTFVCLLFLNANTIDLYGTILSVDNANKTITIEQLNGSKANVKIYPHTKIELENCGTFGTDKDGVFNDLKVGQFVEVDVFDMDKNIINAKEVEIDCDKKKAY